MAMTPRQPAPPTGPPILSYPRPGLTARPLVRPRQYLSDMVMTGGLVGIVVLAMSVVGRIEQIFRTFHLKLPWLTAAVLDLHAIYNDWFVWIGIWMIPVVAPLLLGQAKRRWRRWAYLAAFALAAFVILAIVVAMMVPLTTLIEGISKPGGS